MRRRFAISDIHGCVRSFKALLKQVGFDRKDELYLLGDYIDRGPDSKGVIDYIWELQNDGYALHCLRGNHEQMALEALAGAGGMEEEFWNRNGGRDTLASFSVDRAGEIPGPYLAFMAGLPLWLEIDGWLLVHAGLNFDAGDPLEDKKAMLWIRDWYQSIDKAWLGDRAIIHGHTPSQLYFIQLQLKNLSRNQALCIDGGCVFPWLGMGYLCAFELTSRYLFVQENVDLPI